MEGTKGSVNKSHYLPCFSVHQHAFGNKREGLEASDVLMENVPTHDTGLELDDL